MVDEDKLEREAAICENCGTATAVRVGPEGSIRPIGDEKGKCCEKTVFRIIDKNTDYDALY